MRNADKTRLLQVSAELDDQWLLYSEHSAFVGEAYARLLSDHPSIPKAVIQGADYEVRLLRQKSQLITEKLDLLRKLIREGPS